MQADYEGYAYSVKKLLKEGEKNSAIKSKMVGVVASLIKVPEKFETAIEVALGNNLQNIVTFDENGTKELISYLKDNRYGRATFLPITTSFKKELSRSAISARDMLFKLFNSYFWVLAKKPKPAFTGASFSTSAL